MQNSYQIGDTVMGNWKLTRLLGAGSFGNVFEAERTDFGVVYRSAIKIIAIPQDQREVRNVRSEGMDEKSVTSYFYGLVEEQVKEFELMSKLKGTANIVSYEDHMVLEHKGNFGWDILIRMELLTPLADWLDKNPMTPKDVVKLGIDICHGLELCQKFRIIHRDIKPENIFVSEFGDFKLGDFGVARMAERTSGNLSYKGTYNYMAPEVYLKKKYGSSVDLYSLGIVLYWLLNDNRLPFLPPYPEPITYNDREMATARRMRGEELPVPGHADERLAEIVKKAASYYPENRYDSAAVMRQELEGYSSSKLSVEIDGRKRESLIPEKITLCNGSSAQETDRTMLLWKKNATVKMDYLEDEPETDRAEVEEKKVKEIEEILVEGARETIKPEEEPKDPKEVKERGRKNPKLIRRYKVIAVIGAVIIMFVAGIGVYQNQQNVDVDIKVMMESASNKEKAFKRLVKKADNGDLEAMILLGSYYFNGKNWDDFTVMADPGKAIKYWSKAADLGDINSMIMVGTCYYSGMGGEPVYEKAVEYYQKAVDLGDSFALCLLGSCYEKGLGVDQNYRKAVEYYQKDADLGGAAGLYNLGRCYEMGLGVNQNYRKAVEYYQKAANLGSAASLYSLGQCYRKGHGVNFDDKKAVEYYQEAANLGNTDALNSLGVSYEFGTGVNRDIQKAVEYYQKAADLGNTKALSNLERIERIYSKER